MAESSVQKRQGRATKSLRQLLVCFFFCLVASFSVQGVPSGVTAAELNEVVSLVQQGKLKAAEARLKEAAVADPNNGAIYRLLGIVYQHQARFVQAEQAFEKAITILGDNDPQLLFLLSQTEFALHKRNEGLRLAQRISALTEANPIAHYSLGRLLLANDSIAEAVAELEKAHALATGNPAITTELIIAYLRAKQDEVARTLMTSFFRHASYDDLVQAGARFGDASQFAAAERALRLAVEAKPRDYDASFNLAFAEYRQGKMNEALSTLNSIDIRMAYRQWDYYYLRGKVELALHQNRTAAMQLLRALELKPADESLCSDAGLLFFRSEDFWRALHVYKTCAVQLPGSAPVETGLGLTYFRLGKYNDAITTFRNVLRVHPEADAAREALCFLLYVEGKEEAAREALEARTGAGGADYYLYYLDALVLLRLHPPGDHSAALGMLGEALQKNPTFAPAYFERARIWRVRKNPQRALRDLRRATEADPHYAQPYYLIAQLEYKLGKKEEAKEAQLRFGALNREKEEKQQEQVVENRLLESLR